MIWRRPFLKKRKAQAGIPHEPSRPSWRSKKAVGKFLVDLFEAFMNS